MTVLLAVVELFKVVDVRDFVVALAWVSVVDFEDVEDRVEDNEVEEEAVGEVSEDDFIVKVVLEVAVAVIVVIASPLLSVAVLLSLLVIEGALPLPDELAVTPPLTE